jgi:hypothetical protein
LNVARQSKENRRSYCFEVVLLVPFQVLVTSSKKRQAAVIHVIELQEISTSDHVDEDGEDKCDSKNIW